MMESYYGERPSCIYQSLRIASKPDMFPAIIQDSLQFYIDKYKDVVLDYKVLNVDGGGSFVYVVEDAVMFLKENREITALTIRRLSM